MAEIEKVYPNWYSPDSPLSRDDQQWIWENTKLTNGLSVHNPPEHKQVGLKTDKEEQFKEGLQPNQDRGNFESLHNPTEKSVIVNGSVIGSWKLPGNEEETSRKNEANIKLRACNFKTPPIEIAEYLESLFGNWKSKPGHWLYVAQRYTPKSIISVVNEMVKQTIRGETSFQVPGAYFTKLIKFHSLRKAFRRPVENHGK